MRYYKVDKEVTRLLDKVKAKRFSYLEEEEITFKVLMDSKIKVDPKRGSMVLARIRPLSEVELYLVESTGKSDYFIFLNPVVWELASKKDKIRILSHELRHVYLKDEKRKTIKHDIEDFVAEIKLNKDDIDWGKKLCTKAMEEIERRKEEEEE